MDKSTHPSIARSDGFSLSPIVELVSNCNSQPNQIKEIGNDVESEVFFTALESHRLLNVTHHNIGKNIAYFSSPVQTIWNQKYTANKYRILSHVGELYAVLGIFSKHNIEAISLKGPMLSLRYYDDYTLRECNDLDILVRLSDVEQAFQLLKNRGYELSEIALKTPKQIEIYFQNYHHYCLYNAERGIQIELHWQLFSSQNYSIYEKSEYWSRTEIIKIAGLNVLVLSKYDNFLYLCIHGGTHQWNRMFWVYDIVRIIFAEEKKFVENVYQIAIDQKRERFVLQALHLAAILFKIILPDVIVEAIKSDKSVQKLSRIAIYNLNTLSDVSPSFNLNTLSVSVKKIFNHYTSVYYLGGISGILYHVRKTFINPSFWHIYSFGDQYFVLNYLAAPFMGVYLSLKNTYTKTFKNHEK